MREAAVKVISFTEGQDETAFSSNEVIQLAVIKLFEIIGEASYHLDAGYKADHPSIEWRKIEGLRHILVHDYYRVAPEVLWNTKELYLGGLIQALTDLIELEGEG